MNVLKEQLEANTKLALVRFAENHMKTTPQNSKQLFSDTIVTKQFVNWINQIYN